MFNVCVRDSLELSMNFFYGDKNPCFLSYYLFILPSFIIFFISNDEGLLCSPLFSTIGLKSFRHNAQI